MTELALPSVNTIWNEGTAPWNYNPPMVYDSRHNLLWLIGLEFPDPGNCKLAIPVALSLDFSASQTDPVMHEYKTRDVFNQYAPPSNIALEPDGSLGFFVGVSAGDFFDPWFCRLAFGAPSPVCGQINTGFLSRQWPRLGTSAYIPLKNPDTHNYRQFAPGKLTGNDSIQQFDSIFLQYSQAKKQYVLAAEGLQYTVFLIGIDTFPFSSSWQFNLTDQGFNGVDNLYVRNGYAVVIDYVSSSADKMILRLSDQEVASRTSHFSNAILPPRVDGFFW